MMSTQAAAVPLLLLAALLWGAGNVGNKLVLADVGPLTAVSLRVAVACVVLLPWAVTAGLPGWRWVRSALCLTVCFALAIGLQQCALQETTVTNVGFLVNTCCVIVPFLAFVAHGRVPAMPIVLSAMATLIGAFLMTGGSFDPGHMNRGDVICLLSAGFYAAWMVLLEQHLRQFGYAHATCAFQFGVAALVLLPAAAVQERPTLVAIQAVLPALVVLGILATAVPYLVQVRVQQHMTASVAAVVVSAESLFGAVCAYGWLGERTTPMGMTGAALILAGIVLAAAQQGQPQGTLPAFRSVRRGGQAMPVKGRDKSPARRRVPAG